MSEKYKEYCMKFSNEEIRAYMVDYLISNSMNNKLIKYLSEDGDEIQFNTSEKIGTIVFDGDDENLFINFYGIHTSIFVDDTEHFEVEKYGKVAEVHPMFPKKANIEFAHVIDRTHMSMRVWERGSGETMACGTGASATLVAAVLNGLCDRKVRIQLLGGTLEIEWRESDNHVYMTGPARFSFDGVWLR